MSDSSKVLVELGRIAYIAAATRAADSQKVCEHARQDRVVEEGELQKCAAKRNQLADVLGSAGKARGLHHTLAFDRLLEGVSQRQSERLDLANERQAEAELVHVERQTQTRHQLARLRLAENLLRREQRARRQRQERLREEEYAESARS